MKTAGDIGLIFGEVLRRHRSEKNISLEELAHRADVDRTFASRLERGIRQPTITTLIGLGSGNRRRVSAPALGTRGRHRRRSPQGRRRLLATTTGCLCRLCASGQGTPNTDFGGGSR
ncbi:MAG: helix-turn-helix transcriptional regulator [Zoogloea sp.]|nr:helix-turn-helix transcriptional regulator [Zoogloea sp.]